MNGIAEKVREIVVEALGVAPQEVTPAARFDEDLGADSLDAIELTMRCEQEFAIEIPDADAEHLKTVQQLVDYIAARAATV